MKEIIELEKINVENMIYEIRGKQVMLDSDLAKLYGTETKRINEAVKNNPEKFPERFSFKIDKKEIECFLVENFGQKNETRGGKYKNPRVFTEQGVAMLATILKSPIATQVSIAIMDAFVAMRHTLFNHNSTIEYKLLEHDKRIVLLEKTFNNFKEKSNHLFFEGQIYDAYSLLINILNESTKSITIIDNYLDKKILDICAKTNKDVEIITQKQNQIDIEKYKKQYNNINIKISNTFHDRFIFIDDEYLYHCGASFKDLGKKCFAINRIEDEEFIEQLKDKIKRTYIK